MSTETSSKPSTFLPATNDRIIIQQSESNSTSSNNSQSAEHDSNISQKHHEVRDTKMNLITHTNPSTTFNNSNNNNNQNDINNSNNNHNGNNMNNNNSNNINNLNRTANSNNRFSIGSIKLMIESAEIGKLTDEAALFMSNQVTQKLRTIIKEAEKFCYHSKRRKLMTKDVDYAMKVMNLPPVLGFSCNDVIPFRFASGGGHKIFYHDDKEIELADVIARVNIPKLPQEVSIESHWLAIDGVQPAIPENPPPLSREEQRLECVDPLESLNNRAPFMGVFGGDHYSNTYAYNTQTFCGVEIGPDGRKTLIDSHINKSGNKVHKPNLAGIANINVLKKHIETVQVKQLATHELSVEQQLYYKEITEACVGSIEQKRCQALNSLSHDPGLHQMLPRLCTFISEGVKVNVVHNNLALLIYLMRMVKALLENTTLYLEKYLHELCPTVITCIVSKQICNRPEQDNHYALRDFAARLLANICKTYNTSTNCLQTRITRLLCKALDNPNLPLSSVYGCLSALIELGPEVQKALLVRRIKMIHDRLKPTSPRSSPDRPSRGSPEGRIFGLLAKHDLHLSDQDNTNKTSI